ncbi:MAG: lipopolysaccharide export system ATP-binding protein [Rhodothermales bacterium]|jgi:lipopolysaccharide export system ATP-binding protein
MPIQEIEQALERFKEGDPMGAIPVLEEAVRQIPSYLLAHVMLAQAYESTQQEEKAVRSWQRAHSLIPNSPLRTPMAPMEEADPDFADFLDHLQKIDRGVLPSANSTDPPGHTPVREVPSPELEGLIPRGKGGSVAVRGYAVKSIYGKAQASTAAAGQVVIGDPHAEPVFTGVPGGAILSATDLVKRYRKRSVVKSISLEVRQGEIVGLLGPNGAGKTTTFYMIVGLVEPDAGAVSLDLTNLTKLPMYERARRGIGYLAQEASIFTQLTVEKNLEAVLEYQKLSKAQRKQRVDELIAEFGLHRVRKSKGYMLSGGERRRTEIARALATRPKFFLLDEPFAGVDPIAVEDIQAVVAGLKARGIGVLITDHNVHETLAIVDRAYLLYEGKILKQGTAEALVADEEVRRRYLGESFTLQRYKKP